MYTETEAKSHIIKKALTEIRKLKYELSLKQNPGSEPIAVIGMACRFPGGIANPEEFWKALIEQRDMIGGVPDRRWQKYRGKNILDNPYLKKAGFLAEDIEAFDHRLFRFSPKEAERTDPQQRLFLKVCWEALENSGYAPDKLKGSKTGVYAGASLLDYANELFLHQKINASLDAGDVTGSGFSFISGRVAYFFGFQGPGITVDTACSSSLVAVDQACKGLITGDCDMAVAGGVNLMYCPETTELLSRLNILSPDCAIRSFDAKANGTVRGEGCGVVVLKKLSAAERDGDHIHAIIRGSGVNQDGLSSGLTAPYGPAQEKLITNVWKRCRLNSADIGYIEAHGTGTELGDPIEIAALGNILSKDRNTPLYVGTVKANIGHLEAAAGIAGLIKAILAVEKGKVPGNPHFEIPSPHIPWNEIPVEVPIKTFAWENSLDRPRIAGVSSFGLSGTNAHAVVEQYRGEPRHEPGNFHHYGNGKIWPFKFSSVTKSGLDDQLESFFGHLVKTETDRGTSFPDLSYSQNVSKADLKERMVIWASSSAELKEQIRQALEGKMNPAVSRGSGDKKVIFLFTGQGSQYPAMFAEFYRENRVFKFWLDQCNQYYQANTGNDLTEIIFSSGSLLHETRYAQPALFAVEYSLARMWMEYGVEPAILAGHSVGEYAAACLAGVFDLPDAVKLITARGELMSALPKQGKMAAVSAGKEIVQSMLRDKKRVSIAATNTPEQTVISGDEREVNDVCAALKNGGIKTVPLQVSHAFHSPLMEPVMARFEAVAREVNYFIPSKTLISNMTGGPIGAGVASWEYWSRHILAEVRFYESIRSLENPGEYLFLEIGPAPVLAAMVECIWGGQADCAASNVPGVKTAEQIEKSIFHLYNGGAEIQWKKYYAAAGFKKVAVPNYRFRERHFGLEERSDSFQKDDEAEKAALPGADPSGQPFANRDEVKRYIRAALGRELKTGEEELADDENLLLYGLNSIAATRLVALWKRDLAVPLNLSVFLRNCTINQWVELIYEKIANPETDAGEIIPFRSYPDKRYEPFPLSEVQYAYWAGRNPEMAWGGVGCYASLEIDRKELDPVRFEQALSALIQRHEMLRAIISPDGTQRIMPEMKPPLTVYHRELIQDLQAHLEMVREEISTQVIPLGKPMFDIRLTEMNGGQWRIHFGIDFMIADALSLYIFWRDLSRLYSGGELPALEVSYKDYLNYTGERRKSRRYELDKKYWTERAEGFPAAPEIPVNWSGEKSATGKFVRRKKLLDRETWLDFVRSAAGQNLTPSAALLSLYAEILSAWGGGRRFAVMLTVFDREAVHPQINQIIGDFTQLMLVEIRRENMAVALNAAAIQWQMQADIEHSNYSALDFVKELNRRDNSQERIYPVVFTSALGVEDQDDAPGPEAFLNNMGWSISSTPQVWMDHQVYHEKGGVALSWDTLDAVFHRDVIDSMFAKYTELVTRAAKDQNFWQETLTDLRTESQRHSHGKANNTSKEIKDTLLHEFIRTRTITDGDKTAVVFDNKQYSYRQLTGRANQVSELLQEQGVQKGDKVALQMAKSFEQISVVLGIVQAGAAYIPISCDQPVSRTLDILRKSEATVLFADSYLNIQEGAIQQFTPSDLDGKKGVWHETEISPSDPAYVIYTSGSTGIPKGVCIGHRAAMNTILDVNSHLGVTAEDRVLGVSSLSFDLSVYDIFGLLTAGGTLVLPTESERMDPKCWRRLSLDHHITLWNSVPALMDIYADFILGGGSSGKDTGIRHIILSGDWIPLGLFDKIKRALPKAKLTSMGGATEASIWSNYYDVTGIEPEWRSIPYGYPLANQRFYILDEFGRPCPDWVKGKLHIAGKGLADGYLNEAELTSQAFFHHGILNQRLYDTGDYGRYMPDGAMEFLGRKDNQLKINGYRIEIGEIQAAFGKCGISGDSVILPVGDRMETKKLIAYVKCDPASFSEPDLKNRLQAHLPGYFIPERIIAVNDFPVTPNGKIDRKKLLEVFRGPAQPAGAPANRGISADHPVLRAVREILNLPELKPGDDFGGMGVSSVDMIRLANHLEILFSDRPSVGEMMRYRAVSELIDFYRDKNTGSAGKDEAQSPPDSRFCMFSQDQIKYLSRMELIVDGDHREYFRKEISSRRSELTSNGKIHVAVDESGLPRELCFWRKSYHEFLQARIDNDSFQRFLALCLQKAPDKNQKFNYGSAGGIYPVQIYLSVFKGRIEGIEAGSYYLDVQEHTLVELHQDETPVPDSLATEYGLITNAAFIMHFVGDLDAVYPIHERNSLKFCFIETGSICQLLETYAGLFNIGCCQLEAYEFEKHRNLFDLSMRHYYLHSMAAGKIDFKLEKAKMKESLSAAPGNFGAMETLAGKCLAKGIQLWTEDDRLKFKAPGGAMTPEIQAELRSNKENLIRYLRENSPKAGSDFLLGTRRAFRLTPIQMAYVLGRSPDYELGNTSAHYYSEFECGNIDPVRLEQAVNEVVGKHEMLRTVIYDNGTQQVLTDIPVFKIPVHSIADKEKLEEIRSQWSHHRYELGKWPMFHIQISRLNGNLSRLHFSFDCLIVDGWSAEMMLREIFRAYAGKPVIQPDFTFREYIQKAEHWLKEKSGLKEAENYWNERIQNIPPAPELPLRKKFGAISQPHFRRRKLVLPPEDWRILAERIKRYRFTPSAVICTAYMKVLSCFSSRKDITLNLTLFNRLPLDKDVPKILGDFTNVTLISFRHDSESSLVKEVGEIQDQLWKAVEYRTYNGLDLLRRLSKDSPGKAVMPVVFTSLLSGEASGTDEGLFPPDMKEIYGISQTPQVVIDHQAYERNGSIALIWDYVEEAFEDSLIRDMFATYGSLIERMITEENWNQVFNVSFLGPTNKLRIEEF